MKATQKIFNSAKLLSFSALMIFGMVQCSEEQVIAEEKISEDIATEMTSVTEDVGSLSVSGIFTEFSGDVDCAVCSYTVDPSEKVIDGKILGLKAGSVICLKKAVKYSAVDFVNLEGTAQSPITIGYCSK